MYLAIDEKWIEDHTGIVTSDDSPEFNLARIGINLNDSDVCSKRECWSACGKI